MIIFQSFSAICLWSSSNDMHLFMYLYQYVYKQTIKMLMYASVHSCVSIHESQSNLG